MTAHLLYMCCSYRACLHDDSFSRSRPACCPVQISVATVDEYRTWYSRALTASDESIRADLQKELAANQASVDAFPVQSLAINELLDKTDKYCSLFCGNNDAVSTPCAMYQLAVKKAMNTDLTMLSISGSRGEVQDDLLQTMGSMVDTSKSLREYSSSIARYQDLNNSALTISNYDEVRKDRTYLCTSPKGYHLGWYTSAQRVSIVSLWADVSKCLSGEPAQT